MLKKLVFAFASTLIFASVAINPINASEPGFSVRSPISGLGDQFGLSPFWDWKTIESRHFRVTFPAELQVMANKTTNYLEEAHKLLSPVLQWTPHYKVQVLVIDNTDAANGLSGAVGRIGMVLMVTPPDPWFSTAYYDNWLRLLVIHEYTHFLNMDPTRGVVWESLRVLIGDVLLPNSFWPTWMLEGMSVYMETRFTTAGRGRSPYYEMLLRAAVEEKVLNTEEFITLDKVNGTNPWYPGGETPYVFGFQLMNQVAEDPHQILPVDPEEQEFKLTADREETIRSNEDKLGIMSKRSSRRVPYFINGNLQNITGKDWYHFWAQWVQETRKRTEAELNKIKSQPVTKVHRLTEQGFKVLGTAASPDGNWIAYTRDDQDRRSGLYIQNLNTGKAKRIDDKLMGVGMAFTPDSKALIFSALRQQYQYYLFSDLAVYNLESDSSHWLSDFKRYRDPDISPDGKLITFSYTETAKTGIAVAKLDRDGSKFKLSEAKKVFIPELYDRASNPKFSSHETIVFSLHSNDENSEDLVEVSLSGGPLRTLVSNGFYNRYPAFDSNGSLYFVSDATGVDNLFRYKDGQKPAQVTNVTTGLWLPAFGPSTFYASVFSARGWDLAKMDIDASPINTDAVAIVGASGDSAAPKIDEKSKNTAESKEHEAEDYSIFPSIWPRQWTPLLVVMPSGVYAGGTVLGFDAVDRHRYLLGAAYNSVSQRGDVLGVYSNRSFGPTLTGIYGDRSISTTYYKSDYSVYSLIREKRFSGTISYPLRWTYSAFTPTLGINASREFLYVPNLSDKAIAKSRYVPSADLVLSFSSAEGSRLAISPEGGRQSILGTRVYREETKPSWKGVFFDTEYLRVTSHSVLVPSVKAATVSRQSAIHTFSNVVLSGSAGTWFNAFAPDSFDELGIRGYPGMSFFTKAAVIPALEYRFPIWRIFRGWGTNPIFANNIYGFTFLEGSYFPLNSTTVFLPAAGAGINLSTEFFLHVPLTFSLQYHHGFKSSFGGKDELIFGLNLPAIQI